MKIRRTDNRDIAYWEVDTVFQSCGVAAFKIDRRDGKSQVTPVLCDGSEQPIGL
jgi:hypothetical protein